MLLSLAVIYTLGLFLMSSRIRKLKYSEFIDLLNAGRVYSARVSENKITGKLVNDGRFFVVRLPGDELAKRLEEAKVPEFEGEPKSALLQVLAWVLPFAAIIVLWVLLTRQLTKTSSSVMSFSRSRAKIAAERDTKTTFKDVAGCEEAKEELMEVIEFLRNPRKFQRLGGRVPKGVLIVGPPGTGKTLLARAVAGEASVPFFSISGSDFVEMFVGVGAARVRDLFNQAKSRTPCIIFIDELDAVGRHRGAGLGGGHDEREQTLNQLLVEMDGFETNLGLVVMAATNRPDILDPALLRPGRFDRQIVVDAPDVRGRRAILEVHTEGKPLADDVELDILARRTPGFTGADLANVVNEAALLAARRNKELITMVEFEEAIDRVVAGPERRSRLLSSEEKRRVAIHESGHTVVSAYTRHSDPVHKISIVPRGHSALGFTLQLPTEDRYLITRSELQDRLAVLLGGRAAEELCLGEASTGASDDLEKASNIARSMVCQYGMSDGLGPVTYGRRERLVFLGKDLSEERQNYSEETARRIDSAVRSIVGSAYNQARQILEAHKDQLLSLCEELQQKETLQTEELRELLGLDEKGKAKDPHSAREEEKV